MDTQKYIISIGKSRWAKSWRNTPVTWAEFCARLEKTYRTLETVGEYRRLSKAKQDEIKDVGGFVAGELKGGRRKTDHLINRSMITLDADFATMSLWDDFTILYGCKAAVYSTHKHTPNSPRLRLVIPLSRAVTPEEYPAIARKIASDVGIDLFDDTTYEPSRLMYWPSTPKDGDYVFRAQDGETLDPDEILKTYPDWHDTSYWPVSSRVAGVLKKRGDKQSDPTEKPGLIGAFCRVYDIPGAIETFLPDVYARCDDNEDRYTYLAGSTAGGLIVYNDGKFAYSHHGTDPASGQLCNAFDLVRIHRFGDLDADVGADTDTTKLPSYKAMIEFARSDDAVRIQHGKEKISEATEDFADPPPEPDDGKWLKKLSVKADGAYANTIGNVVVILSNDPRIKGRIQFNEFKGRIVFRKDLPWRKVKNTTNGDNWMDSDDAQLRAYVEKVYGISSPGKIYDAVAIAADNCRFHPVREYLDKLSWDGKDRLDTLLIDTLGAEDTTYTRAVTRKAFTAAVARIFRPGCKFDYVLTIQGRQGVGKSTLVARMGGDFVTDSLSGIGSKEAYEGIQGFWICELGELAALKKTELESIKNFISKTCDSYRAAYGRRVEDHLRQCIFIGTTNSTAFLRDDTGNRRFWPVRCEVDLPSMSPFDITNELRDQLWAEAVERYKEGEQLKLSESLEAVALKMQMEYTETDPREGIILEYLDRLLPADWPEKDLLERRTWLSGDFGSAETGTVQRQRVCVAEIWQECFNRDAGSLKRQDTLELMGILRKLPGWEEAKMKQRCGRLYGVQRVFQRIVR